jgi:hypothetical protein
VKIPKQITIGSTTYEIRQPKHIKRRGMMGELNLDKCVVDVATNSNISGIRFKAEDRFDTFWHELTHAILYDMGSKLNEDEKFVTAFANRLNQAILSAK